MRYKVYKTSMPSPDGVRKCDPFCETNSDTVAHAATQEARKSLGQAMVVIVLKDDKVDQVLSGTA